MKKQLFLSLFAIAAAAGTAMAQNGVQAQPTTAATSPAPGGMQQKAPNERAKETVLKLQDALPLTDGQGAKLMPVFTDYYTARQKAMEDMRASGTMDRDAMKATNDKLVAERDEKMTGILTADQMKKWKDEIEPSLRPQRGGQKQ